MYMLTTSGRRKYGNMQIAVRLALIASLKMYTRQKQQLNSYSDDKQDIRITIHHPHHVTLNDQILPFWGSNIKDDWPSLTHVPLVNLWKRMEMSTSSRATRPSAGVTDAVLIENLQENLFKMWFYLMFSL